MATTYVLFHSLDLAINPTIFNFYYSCNSDGVYTISSCFYCKFITNMPTSYKHQKEHFFFLHIPQFPNCPTAWLPGLLLQPELVSSHKQSTFFIRFQKGFGGRDYDARTLLHEDFLHEYGLSSRGIASAARYGAIAKGSVELGHRTALGPSLIGNLFYWLVCLFLLIVFDCFLVGPDQMNLRAILSCQASKDRVAAPPMHQPRCPDLSPQPSHSRGRTHQLLPRDPRQHPGIQAPWIGKKNGL